MFPWVLSGGLALVGLVVGFFLRWRLARAEGGLALETTRANALAGELVSAQAAASDEKARGKAQTEALRAENKILSDGMAELAERYPALAGLYLRGVFARARAATAGSGPHTSVQGPPTATVPGGGDRGGR